MLWFVHVETVLVRNFTNHGVVGTKALNLVVWCFHIWIWKYHHQAAMTLFNASDQRALFIQKEGCNRHRNDCPNLSCVVFRCFFFNEAKNRQA